MDRSQQTNSTRESLRKIRQETRQTRSLETLRQNFEQLQNLRRQSMDDFDLQVMIGDIHQEIVDRARYLRGESPTPVSPHEDHSVIFQAKPANAKPEERVTPPVVAAAPPVEPPPALPPVTPLEVPAPPPPPQPARFVAAAPAAPAERVPSPEAAEIPPEVTRIDATSWKKILWLATFLCVIALSVIFIAIQAARKVYFSGENRAQNEQAAKQSTTPAVSISPTLRLYTDLTPGTAVIDDNAPRSLVDGELVLDNLPAGQHSVKVSGSSGSASFQFEVVGKNAPQVIGTPQASNALLVLVSQQDGHGQIITSAGPAQILVDGKTIGRTTATGLELVGLGTTNHDLQVIHERDSQPFYIAYTPAPVLNVYVKSDPNTGIIQLIAGEDNVEVYIDDVLFRRRTEHGQVRISIRAGRYSIRVHKDGLPDPPAQWVEVKKSDVTQASFEFPATGVVAGLQIHGAQPGTTTYIDHDFVGAVGADGNAKVSNIKPGEHTIELRHDLAVTKRLLRTFRSGETLTLSGPDVTLEKSSADGSKPSSPAVVVPVGSTGDVNKSANPVGGENQLDGAHVQRGGGFVPYDTPKSPGHYSFRTQGHVGGILKKSKLQWYAGYKDPQNYILFSLDGKHAEVREMRNGKTILWNRVSCSVDSSSWVQVDLAVKPGTVSSRVRTEGEGWVDLGAVASFGRDFTQDKVGFYIPPNDEVAVANFKFAR